MKFVKSGFFKYIKNLIIGVGAAVVLIGALYKIMSWPGADEMLQIGLFTEAGLFLMLGILPPDSDYYWSKLYPGLDDYNSTIQPITAGGGGASASVKFDSAKLESQNDEMIKELQSMSKSLSALKALDNANFQGVSDGINAMNGFVQKMNAAAKELEGADQNAKALKEQFSALNQNLGSLNKVYGGMLTAMKG
jgi:hypothetical protein